MNTVITNDSHLVPEQNNITSFAQEDLAVSSSVNILNASGELTEQEKVAVSVPKPKDGIYELCNARKDKLLPFLNNNTLLFEKLARSFAWEINTNDKLKICSQLSIINAFYKCCEYGLDPAASLGQAWLIPYNVSLG